MFYKISKKIVKVVFYNKLKKINKLKDRHKNETCYIIGTGASIKEFAETLKDDDLKRQFQRLAARVSGNHPPDQTS